MWRSPITRTSTYSKHGGVGNTRGGEGAARVSRWFTIVMPKLRLVPWGVNFVTWM